MAVRNRITEKNPRTGALPAEQAAESAKKQSGQGHVLQMDKMVYQLVENNVKHAGEQFGENLRFNSEVLTNVLYDNIYDLLGDKFNEDEFVNQVAEDLVSKGCVIREEEPQVEPSQQEGQVEPKEEVVYELDDIAYTELKVKVGAAIELIKASRLTLFKMLADVNDQVGELSRGEQIEIDYHDSELLKRRDDEIAEIVKRLQGNQEKVENYIAAQDANRKEIDEKVDGIQKRMQDSIAKRQQQNLTSQKTGDSIRSTIGKIGENANPERTDPRRVEGNIYQIQKKPILVQKLFGKQWKYVLPREVDGGKQVSGTKLGKAGGSSIITRANVFKGSDGGKSAYGGDYWEVNDKAHARENEDTKIISIGKIGKAVRKANVGKENEHRNGGKPKKPTIVQRIKGKLKDAGRMVAGKARSVGRRVKDRISNSFMGKTYRAISKVVVSMGKTIAKVYGAVKKTMVVAYKAVKFAAKAFVAASRTVGKAVRAVGKAAVSGVKKMMALAKAGKLRAAIRNFAPAQIVTKMGFGLLKFTGKKIWGGLKKLAFKAASFFRGLFKMAGRFVNKIGSWVGRLSAGIKDRAYRFLVKPIAAMMVTVFNFFTGLIMSPINYMKWLVPSIFDRILSSISYIGQGVKRVLRATKTIFKKILTSPLTIALIVVGMFYILCKPFRGWLNNMVCGIGRWIRSGITTIISGVWSFLKGAWTVVSTVGKFLFEFVEKITSPDGWIVKSVTWLVKTFFKVKKWISNMITVAGKDSIDAFCMFISGDYLGIAIHAISGMVIKMWEWIKNKGFIKVMLGLIKGLFKLHAMIWRMPLTLGESLLRAGAALAKWILTAGTMGSLGDIGSQFAKPWKRWWNDLNEIFAGKADDVSDPQYVTENPIEQNAENNTRINIAVRSLKMKGKPEKNLEYLERWAAMNKWKGAEGIRQQIENMSKIYHVNSEQMGKYDKFIQEVWDRGKTTPEMAQQVMRVLLESPDMSQRLLSAFFYYDPQTGNTMSIMPIANIGKFVEYVRYMVMDPERDDLATFKTIIQNFDQANKERAVIINNQAYVLSDLSERIHNFDQSSKNVETNGAVELREYLKRLNDKTLFNNVKAESMFQQIKDGSARTKNIKSVTGEKFETGALLQAAALPDEKGGDTPPKKQDFVVKPPQKEEEREERKEKKTQFGNVSLPTGMGEPPPSPVKIDTSVKNVEQRWLEHQRKRGELLNKMSTPEVDAAGYEALTLEQFMRRETDKAKAGKPMSVTPEELEREKAAKAKRLAGRRLVNDVTAYHSQGKEANVDGFTIGKQPSILKINTDSLNQIVYMFSPEWERMNGAAKLSDDQLLLQLDANDAVARERVKKAKEAEAKKRDEQERRKRHEQAILDYSAKVEGGYIEVKVGEDVDAMQEAYNVYLNKLAEAMNTIPEDKLEEMGFKNYTWEEWKRYYRKMHGLPEDGIKRIPFEGKKKERKIDWSTRFALSTQELEKYGITMSEDGPVMIPLDKAMAAAGSLLKEAKTIHSVRDGLEVMRNGLRVETEKLRKQREDGVPVAVIQGGSSDDGETTVSTPPDQSSYSEPG